MSTVVSPWASLSDAAREKIDRTIPAGEYTVTLADARPGITTGMKPKFVFEWEITAGDFAGDTFKTTQVVSFDSEEAMDFFFNRMATLGAPVDFFTDETVTPEKVCKRIARTGQVFKVELTYRTFKGRENIELTSLEPVEAGE